MTKCYNPEHNHDHPSESTEHQAKFYQAACEAMIAINPKAFHLLCNCGTPIDYCAQPFVTQSVTADPISLDQTRIRVKAYKALYGDNFPISTDHNEIWYESTIGTDAVLIEKRAFNERSTEDEHFKTWVGVANKYELHKG